jgi:hypothetical protein
LIGCDPIGCPFAFRHRAWCNRAARRKAVTSGRPGAWSSASQQYAASNSRRLGSVATAKCYAQPVLVGQWADRSDNIVA